MSNYGSFSKIGRKNHYLEILPQSSRIFFLVFSLVRFWILQSESGESVKFIQKSDLCCVFHWWLYIDHYCYLDYLYHIRIFSPWNQYWKKCKRIHIWFSDQNFAFYKNFFRQLRNPHFFQKLSFLLKSKSMTTLPKEMRIAQLSS